MEETNKQPSESNETPVASFDEFINLVVKLIEGNEDKRFIWRGHSKLSYRLIPSVGRGEEEIDVVKEKSMLNEFKRMYYPFTDVCCKKNMDFLFLAQHYGMKTRLLDWTFNPLIALYFSTASHNDEYGCVFVKCIQKNLPLCEEKADVDPFLIPGKQIVLPDNIDLRYIHQQGLFEIFDNPLHESTDYYHKIIIKREAKKNIQKYLRACGITEEFVFPSLDNLAKSINEKYI